MSVAVPAEGQDPGGSPQGDATGEGAVAGGATLPRPALQAAAGHRSPHCYSPLLVTNFDSFPALTAACCYCVYVTSLRIAVVCDLLSSLLCTALLLYAVTLLWLHQGQAMAKHVKRSNAA